MKSLVEFIYEGKTAVNDLLNMISDFLNKKDVEKKDIIVTAKLCSGLNDRVRKLKKNSKYFYTEFEDNKLSKIASIDTSENYADVWSKDEGVNRVEGDEFTDEYGYLLSGSDKGLDMRIWEDPKGIIVNNID